jgi:hypothetical protein
MPTPTTPTPTPTATPTRLGSSGELQLYALQLFDKNYHKFAIHKLQCDDEKLNPPNLNRNSFNKSL